MSNINEPNSPVDWNEMESTPLPVRSLKEFLASVDIIEPICKSGPPLLFIEQEAYQNMIASCRDDVRREHAGVLLGAAFCDSSRQIYVTISDSVLARHTHGSPVHVDFTPESWQEIWNQLSEESKLVGWYHTHPGLGIFLSGTDLRTQRHFFPHAWQIAIVVDPLKSKIGFFYGHNGEAVQQTWIYKANKTKQPLFAVDIAQPAPEDKALIEPEDSRHLEITTQHEEGEIRETPITATETTMPTQEKPRKGLFRRLKLRNSQKTSSS